MKIVKIKKIYRNGSKEHFLVLFDEPYSNDDIDELVEEWCESDPSGIAHGYRYEWVFVNDEEIIKKVINDKIKDTNTKIKSLISMKNKMEKFL